MTDALQGDLKDGALPNLLQFLAMNRATGCLTVRHSSGAQGYVFFSGGAVVHVKSGLQTDIAALATLLQWEAGRFNFRQTTAKPPHTNSLPLDQLLLRAAYQSDTLKHNRNGLFNENTVLVGNVLPEDQQIALTMRAMQLLRHLNGVHSLGEITAHTGMGFGDVLSASEELYRQALVQPIATPLLHARFVADLTHLVVNLMGPVGEIVVEDAVYDLNLAPEAVPRNRVADLIQELKLQLRREDWQATFVRQARALGARYGVEL